MKYKIAIFLLFLTTSPVLSMQQPALNNSKALFAAIHQSDASRVKQLLNANPSLVNTDPSIGIAPLREAAVSGNTEIIQSLLDASSPVDPEDSYDLTPLMMAALGGHLDAIKLLISRGANVNAKDKSNQSVLDYVQFGGGTNAAQKAETTRILKEAGAH